MVKKQWYFVMVLMVVASLLLAACQTPTATPASSENPVEIGNFLLVDCRR